MAVELYDPNSTDQRTRIVPDAEAAVLQARGWLQVPGGGGSVDPVALAANPAFTATYVQKADYVAGSAGMARGYDFASDTAQSTRTPRLNRLNGGAPIMPGGSSPENTHYNWSVIPAYALLTSPVDKYYAYDSPDHGGTGTSGSGIRWYTAPTPAGPWTARRADGSALPAGQPYEYVYRDPAKVETETPTVFHWPQSDGKNLHMLYQEKASGPQVTRMARSADGKVWAQESGFELRSDGDHAGYMRVQRLGQRLIATSRATSGSSGTLDLFAMWHVIGDPKVRASWLLDSRRLLAQEHATGPGWTVAWGNFAPFTWYGQTWAFSTLFPVGKAPWPEFGIGGDDRRLILAPVSADLRRFTGAAVTALTPQGAEVSTDAALRTIQPFTDADGRVYLYYISSDDVFLAEVV